jgi:hypothetical protein
MSTSVPSMLILIMCGMIRLPLVLLALLPLTAAAKEPCKVEHWRISPAGAGASFTYIEGTSNCRTGTIHMRVFGIRGLRSNGFEFLGVVSGHIRGFAFKAVMEGEKPYSTQIKYVIEQP